MLYKREIGFFEKIENCIKDLAEILFRLILFGTPLAISLGFLYLIARVLWKLGN